MLRQTISRVLDDRQKRALKSKFHQAKQRLVQMWLNYDAAQLHTALRKLGLSESDTLLVHSNFDPHSGFKGTPADLADALATFVGDKGNLLMVSIPFRGSAYDHLALNKTFDVRKTISMMGLVTEMFRRRPGTLRSLHPTHPVLASGKDAAWLIADHERCMYPCGPGTPFDKFAQLGGKILFFDVGFGAITFFHHVEHLLQQDMPFPVYDERLFEAAVVDAAGGRHIVRTYAYSKQVPRSAEKLENAMLRRGKIRRGRVGNSRMLLVTAADVLTCQTDMVKSGNYPYDVTV
jgi:aminoglycoside 3-N-acetyltransferase